MQHRDKQCRFIQTRRHICERRDATRFHFLLQELHSTVLAALSRQKQKEIVESCPDSKTKRGIVLHASEPSGVGRRATPRTLKSQKRVWSVSLHHLNSKYGHASTTPKGRRALLRRRRIPRQLASHLRFKLFFIPIHAFNDVSNEYTHRKYQLIDGWTNGFFQCASGLVDIQRETSIWTCMKRKGSRWGQEEP